MPQPSSAVESSAYLRLLVLGAPKVGKTQTILSTCEGPAYVINSDDQYALRPAARVCEFTYDFAPGKDAQTIENCLHEAKIGVKEGRYKTIVWDTISKYASRIVDVYADATNNAAGEPDGRRFWPRYAKHLHSVIDRLFTLKAHVIVTSHYVEGSNILIEGQVRKAGDGVLPGIPGGARTSIAAEFQDIVFFEKRAGKRLFVTSSDGVFGPGCRSLPGVETCEANVQELWKMMQGPKAKTKGAK